MTEAKGSQAKMSACATPLGRSAHGVKKEENPGESPQAFEIVRLDDEIQGNQSVFLGSSLAGLDPVFLGWVKFCAS